ncbi:MAG: 7-carboxy-7-deazaguanine synthase QueE [Nitrospirae bacterium]|nr:7-carboxy-7-deazaguanine synthase QueE [Nitrospirota bacterium]
MINGYVSEMFGSFQGEGPMVGERHLFLRLCCCNLRCQYCDTRDSLTEQPVARISAPDGSGVRSLPNPLRAEVVAELLDSMEPEPGHYYALTVTGGEPLEQPGFLVDILGLLDGRYRVVLETNGTLAGAFREVGHLVDVVSMDVKLPSVTGLGPLWDRHLAFLEECRHKELVVKAVFSEDTPVEEVGHAARLIAGYAPDAVFVLQPMSVSGAVRPQPEDRLLALYMEARRSLANVRVIPQVHKIMGVR